MVNQRFNRWLAIGQKFLDDFGISVRKDHRAARIANKLVRSLDHAVLFAGLLTADFAAGRQPEALFGARFGLHLGHFAFLASRCIHLMHADLSSLVMA